VIVFLLAFFGSVHFLRWQIPCANSETCFGDLSEKIENDSVGIFQGKQVIPPNINFDEEAQGGGVLGTQIPDVDKHIYVDLSTQKLYAYDGESEFMQTLISSGRWGRTPIGNWNVWVKFRSTRMSGGSGSDYYNLPNVPYTMFFHGDFGIHGAYWHNNFGHTMSHGCVNMRIVDAKKLFEWADGPSGGHKGTAVSICSQFIAPNTCIQDKG
jgi:hypothetical protein